MLGKNEVNLVEITTWHARKLYNEVLSHAARLLAPHRYGLFVYGPRFRRAWSNSEEGQVATCLFLKFSEQHCTLYVLYGVLFFLIVN